MEIEEYLIRLTGLASISEKLEVGDDLTLGLNVNIYAAETKNNENGTGSICYKTRPTGEILITKKWGKVPIKGKLRNSPQTRYRFALIKYYQEKGIPEEWETWYSKWIDKKISELINEE